MSSQQLSNTKVNVHKVACAYDMWRNLTLGASFIVVNAAWVRINNHIHYLMLDSINHPSLNFNGGSAKPLLKLYHGVTRAQGFVQI